MINKLDYSKQYNDYYPKLLGFINKHCKDKNTSEDIAQEVWLVLNNNNNEIENVGTWCIGIAKNLLLHHWRRLKNSKVHFTDFNLIQDNFEYSDNSHYFLQNEVLLKKIQDCLIKLPLESQKLFKLKYDENKTYEEISKIVGKKVTTLRVTLSRIRQQLKQSCIN